MNFSAIAANTPEDVLIRYHQKTPDALLFGPSVSALQAQELSRRIGLDAVESYTLHAYSGSTRQDQAQLRTLLEQLKSQVSKTVPVLFKPSSIMTLASL